MKQFPDAIQKRDLLHGRKKLSPEASLSVAKSFEDAGWLSDAVDFGSENEAELQNLSQKAAAEGNTFLLLKIFRVAGKENLELLQQATSTAEALGKVRYAIKGYEKLEKADKVEALKATIVEDGDMKTALNSVFIPKSEEEREDEKQTEE